MMGLFMISNEFKKEIFDPLSYKEARTSVKVYTVVDATIHCFSGPGHPFTPVNKNFQFDINGTTYASVNEFLTEKLFLERTEEDRQKWILNRGLLYMQLAYLEKCKQHPEFLKKLMNTGQSSIIAYCYDHDTFLRHWRDKKCSSEMWKHEQGRINTCVVYPTPFPVLREDLRKIPRIAYGYNVLGALLMSLRDQLLANPINSIAVHIPDSGFTPFVVPTHPAMERSDKRDHHIVKAHLRWNHPHRTNVVELKVTNKNFRQLLQASVCLTKKRRQLKVHSHSEIFICVQVVTSNTSMSRKRSQTNSVFFNNGSARRHSSQSNQSYSQRTRNVDTPLSAMERWMLKTAPTTPAMDEAEQMEQPTTYSCMNTPNPYECEEVEGDNVEEAVTNFNDQHVPPINNSADYQPPMPNLLEIEKSISNYIDIFNTPPHAPVLPRKSFLERLAKNSPVTSETFPLTMSNRLSNPGISPGISTITSMLSNAFASSPLSVPGNPTLTGFNLTATNNTTQSSQIDKNSDSAFKTPRLPSRLQCASASPKEQTLYTFRDIKRRQLGSLNSIPSTSSMSLSTNYDYSASSTTSDLSDLG
ncbi:NADAR domain-containing protein [Aphelenchoides bicaudatus]|nr:NADAR domain-containing protein [Aphelenchoides bicaudatus]